VTTAPVRLDKPILVWSCDSCEIAFEWDNTILGVQVTCPSCGIDAGILQESSVCGECAAPLDIDIDTDGRPYCIYCEDDDDRDPLVPLGPMLLCEEPHTYSDAGEWVSPDDWQRHWRDAHGDES